MSAERQDRRLFIPGAKYASGRMILLLIFAVILFASAGKISWVRGWIYILIVFLLEAGTVIVLAVKAPEVLKQRGTAHSGVKTFDKIFVFTWIIISFITPAVAGVDVRYGLSSMPVIVMYIGLALLIVFYPFGIWAMIENEHFEPFVRIQTDRNHRVVTGGPYRLVRHPGYLGAIGGVLGSPMILGSWWTFIPAVAIAILFVLRTALEDKTLRRELAGYENYALSTRYRLFPGIW